MKDSLSSELVDVSLHSASFQFLQFLQTNKYTNLLMSANLDRLKVKFWHRTFVNDLEKEVKSTVAAEVPGLWEFLTEQNQWIRLFKGHTWRKMKVLQRWNKYCGRSETMELMIQTTANDANDAN